MNIAILAISTLIVLIVFGIPVATHPQWFKTVEEEIEEAKREGHIVTAKPVKLEISIGSYSRFNLIILSANHFTT